MPKICPLKLVYGAGRPLEQLKCEKENCEWWRSDEEACSVRATSQDLSEFRNSGLPVNNHY